MTTKPSTDDLEQAINSIDSLSQQGFSEIGCNYKDKKTLRRYQAEQNLKAEVA